MSFCIFGMNGELFFELTIHSVCKPIFFEFQHRPKLLMMTLQPENKSTKLSYNNGTSDIQLLGKTISEALRETVENILILRHCLCHTWIIG